MDNLSLQKLSNWISRCDKALCDMASLTEASCKAANWNEDESFTIRALLAASFRTSGSALLLVEGGRIWDADILMRSVVEGSIKTIFLLSNRELFGERYGEFSDALFDIGGIKQHRKAEVLINSLKDPSSDKWRPIRELLLPEQMIEEISKKYPRPLRKSLETKWGFTGLITQLGNEDIAAADLFVMLLHGYSMASHALHADCIGVCTALERDYREEKKRKAVHIAHAARIISDVFWLSYARAQRLHKFADIDTVPLARLVESYEDLSADLSQAVKEWGEIEYS